LSAAGVALAKSRFALAEINFARAATRFSFAEAALIDDNVLASTATAAQSFQVIPFDVAVALYDILSTARLVCKCLQIATASYKATGNDYNAAHVHYKGLNDAANTARTYLANVRAPLATARAYLASIAEATLTDDNALEAAVIAEQDDLAFRVAALALDAALAYRAATSLDATTAYEPANFSDAAAAYEAAIASDRAACKAITAYKAMACCVFCGCVRSSCSLCFAPCKLCCFCCSYSDWL